MSKLMIVSVIVVSFALLVGLGFLYEQNTSESFVDIPLPSTGQQPIVIPEGDPDNPKAAQCALCAQIADGVSRELCLSDFACS